MNEEQIKQKFKETYPDFMRGDEPLSPYFDIWEYAIEIATKETENGIQWHKVTDGKLPELDKKVWVIRSADDDLPMVAKRHIYTCYGRTEWEWACYWGSGFDLKQNEIFAWCEIPQF